MPHTPVTQFIYTIKNKKTTTRKILFYKDFFEKEKAAHAFVCIYTQNIFITHFISAHVCKIVCGKYRMRKAQITKPPTQKAGIAINRILQNMSRISKNNQHHDKNRNSETKQAYTYP